jgi:hypothetical protein
MSENHHYEYATAAFSAVNSSAASEFNDECRDDAKTQATLALAYEQRTANLIAMWSKPSTSVGNVTWGIGEETAGQFLQEILERLGVKL